MVGQISKRVKILQHYRNVRIAVLRIRIQVPRFLGDQILKSFAFEQKRLISLNNNFTYIPFFSYFFLTGSGSGSKMTPLRRALAKCENIPPSTNRTVCCYMLEGHA
jgi:hypothetical protein